MHRQASRGILCLCRDVTSDEVCFVDITVVSFYLEEHFVKLVRFVPCTPFLLLIPLCRPLVIRWCIDMSRVIAASQVYVQRWNFVSEFCSF